MTVDGREIIGFASNDYLGLAAHEAIRAALAEGASLYGAGSGGSHLLGGHSRAHAQLEDDLAAFSGGFVDNPRALYFSTGYMANLAVVTALAGRGTLVFSDALNHASLIDGVRLVARSKRRSIRTPTWTRSTPCSTPRATMPRRSSSSPTPCSAWTAISRRSRVSSSSRRSTARGSSSTMRTASACSVRKDAAHLAHYALRSPHLVYVGTLGKAAGVVGRVRRGA